jgi:hypothetical protein
VVTLAADGEYSYAVAHNVNFTFDPALLNLTRLSSTPGSITVAYSVTSSPLVMGYYKISYPFNCPPLIPFAVANGGPSSVSPLDFRGFFEPSSCLTSNRIISSVITGFSGMSAEWMTALDTRQRRLEHSDKCINGMSVSKVDAKMRWSPGLVQALAASQSR